MSAPNNMRLWQAVCLILFFCAFVVHPDAGAEDEFLSIHTRCTVEASPDRVVVEVVYTNKGDATARRLQAHLAVAGKQHKGPVTERLGPGESDSAVFNFPFQGRPGSRYPFIVYVNFRDRNDYPFSALSCATFGFLGDGPDDIACEGSESAFSSRGDVEFEVRNTGTTKVEAFVRLVLPREFSSSGAFDNMVLRPGEEASAVFEVSNSGALSGASYPVFCIVEYETGERFGSAVGTGFVRIEDGGNFFRRNRAVFITVCVSAAVLFLVVLGREMKKPRGPGENQADR